MRTIPVKAIRPFLAPAAVAIAALIPSATVARAQIRAAPPPIMQNPRATQPPARRPDEGRATAPHHEDYTALEFTLWTGDDDLRSTSKAWVGVKFPDGTSQDCVLHDEYDNGWDSNTKRQGRQCIMASPKKWNQLRSATIVLNLHSFNDVLQYGQTSDNWDINEVSVTAIDQADKHYPCLLDVRGKPNLVRLTNNEPSYDLTETLNRC